jgi:prolyl 4-hydroxylase
MTVIDSVQLCLDQGQTARAFAILSEAAAKGDASASFELARWYLDGRLIRRDLAQSRSWFKRAGAAGHDEAQLIHLSLVGSGIGGERDWPEALALLREFAATSPRAAAEIALIDSMSIDGEGDPVAIPAHETVSSSPDVRWVRGLVSPDECAELIALSQPVFRPSVIIDPTNGMARPDPIRTSDAAMFPWVNETPLIHALNRRIAIASGTRVEQGEPLQVLRYLPGQRYSLHSDALPSSHDQRVLTVLVYLNASFGHGETLFPRSHLTLKGAPGDALIFRNIGANGRADRSAVHAGAPVTSGVKYLASRWIREHPFGPR